MKNLIIIGFIAALAGLYFTNEKREKKEESRMAERISQRQ